MNTIVNRTFDEERALYGAENLSVVNCSFDGPADGESALKECRNIEVQNSYFNLRYPFWHDEIIAIQGSELTDACRAALWYSKNITIADTKLHGIKALRECDTVKMQDCSVISPEFGWSVQNLWMADCTVQSEYFMMRSAHLQFQNVQMRGEVFVSVHSRCCI